MLRHFKCYKQFFTSEEFKALYCNTNLTLPRINNNRGGDDDDDEEEEDKEKKRKKKKRGSQS